MDFVRGLSVSDVLMMYAGELFPTLEHVKDAANYINNKIIFEGENFSNQWEITHYEKMMAEISRNDGDNADVPMASGSTLRVQSGGSEASSSLATNSDTVLKYIDVVGETSAFIKKFGLSSRRLTFSFKTMLNEHPLKWLENAIKELLSHVTPGVLADDFIGVQLESEEYPLQPVYVPWRKFSQLTATVILDKFSAVFQSNATFFTNSSLTAKVDSVRLPSGKGYSYTDGKCVSFDVFCTAKSSIFVVENKNNLCLAYALAAALEYENLKFSKKDLKKKFSFKAGQNLLHKKALELCHNANVVLSGGGTYEHLEKFQNYLSRHAIVVYSSRTGKDVYFHGDRTLSKPRLNLIMENNHYNLILSLTAVFAASYFCEFCLYGYNNSMSHKNCPYLCPCCHTQKPCANIPILVTCSVCNRKFRGVDCLQNHLQNKLCSKLKRCNICNKNIWNNQKNKHTCGFEYCAVCCAIKPSSHHCFMSVNKLSENKVSANSTFLFIFFDFETMQEKKVTNFLYEHEVNMCVTQHVCINCITNDAIQSSCTRCGVRQRIFTDDYGDVARQFLNYVSEMSMKFKVTVVAHNFKAFDGCFVLREMMNDVGRWKPNIIRTGSKIMLIKCGESIRFIDSLNFIQLPLAAFPKAFSINTAKGYFPHFFNIRKNKNYIGPLPGRSFYGYNTMKIDARTDFLKWYDSKISENYIFNMRDEIERYCVMDVDILRRSCLQFRKCFKEANNVDPLQECITIASACNLTFRRNFLKPESIGILPRKGYRMADNCSVEALKWLEWESHNRNIIIKHAGNGREVRLIENLLVDGFCCETNTVFEFYGCFWHGCRRCYLNQTEELANKNDAMFTRFENTIYKEERIKAGGYNLVTMWECAFTRKLKFNLDMRDFVNSLHFEDKILPLNPRDAFFGGRTNASKLYYSCESDESIKYYDVCSLYPFINKYGKYPVGHPKNIYIGKEQCSKLDIFKIEGLIKCLTLPPQNLYHPVLPYRCNGKLTFPLCKACVETMFESECFHSDAERQFIGTYVADELRKALECKYKLIEVYEVWEYDIVTYDRETKSGGLFSEYVNKFLTIKQECSGWPSWCSDEDRKNQYISEYKEREGVVLNKSNIVKNSGMRLISKIMLNSFWGKFGQKENSTQTKIVSQPYELFELLNNPGINIQDVTIVNPETVIVTYERVQDDLETLKTVNVVIAAYTTAGARLELYKYLEKLDERVLYYDTDSVIFKHKDGQWLPPIGDYLGDMTDEMQEYGDGSFISEFVSGGPKNYAIKFWNKNKNCFDTVCKVKGLTLHYDNSEKVNFDIIKSMICGDERETSITLSDRVIVRNSRYGVFTKNSTKKYMYKYTKRRRLPDGFDTVPYGFKI